MHLYYSVVDPYPAYRADLAELFAVELRRLGLQTEWFMDASSEQIGVEAVYAGQTVHRPSSCTSKSKLVSKFNYWLSDLKLIGGLLFRKVDAIQCRDKYVASLAGILVARLRNIPFFYWCSYPFPEHDRLAAEAKSGWRRWLGKAKAEVRFLALYKVICPLADHVFVQSKRMREDMHRYGVSLTKMTPVPMGVSAGLSTWIETNPVPVVAYRVVYLGTLASVRRLDTLLEAFALVRKRVPAAQFVFVGDGDVPSERIALERRAAELDLGDSVLFTGFIPMDEARRLSASAAVCISPFYPTPVLASTSPTKLVEYLALGRPVVCNDHPEQSEIVRESGAGLCVEWSSTAFALAIETLLLDVDLAESMAKRGPRWVAEHRTYPTIANAVWEKYQSLVKR